VLECQREEGRLRLKGELRMAFLDTLKRELEEADTSRELEIDISEVSEVDVAGLQMLLAYLRSRPQGAPARLKGHAAGFRRALALTGLEPHFSPYLA